MREAGPLFPKRSIWFAAAMAGLLLLLPLAVRLDGKVAGGWQAMLGRLHPLMVHLPIGLVAVLPVLEILGRRRAALHSGQSSGLQEAAGFLLPVAAFCSVAAALLGLLLAHGGGFTGAAVSRHMWSGVWVAVALLACLLVRPLWVNGRGTTWHVALYPWLLGATVLLLAWASHQGGSLVYGPRYLTEYLPQPLRRWPVLEGDGNEHSESQHQFIRPCEADSIPTAAEEVVVVAMEVEECIR